MKTIRIIPIEHKGNKRLLVQFHYDAELLSILRKIDSTTWSKTHKSWHVADNPENLKALSDLFKGIAFVDTSLVPGEKQLFAGKEIEELIPKSETYSKGWNIISIEVTEKKIILRMPKNDADIRFVNTLKYSRWNQTTFRWEIPNYKDNLELLKQHFGDRLNEIKFMQIPETSVNNSPLSAGNLQPAKNYMETPVKKETSEEVRLQILELRKWMEHKRYSSSTISTYTEALQIFLTFIQPKKADEVEPADMVTFVNEYVIANNLSYSYQNQFINGAKLFFREVIKSTLDVEKFERPRRQHKLPNVLSKDEIAAILRAHTNMKHRTMLSLIYACGLRRSELINLKPTQIDSKRHLLIIVNAKGKKDRVVPISDKVIGMLQEYYKMYRPKVWLFEGQSQGEQYSEKSLQSVLKQALGKTGIKKPVSLHWLRHSYATHLMDSGTDTRYIQEILGHKSSKTTEIYTHVSTKSLQNIKSPFDDL
jgi:integrase/recombinase XerD